MKFVQFSDGPPLEKLAPSGLSAAAPILPAQDGTARRAIASGDRPVQQPRKAGSVGVTFFDLDHTLLPLDSDYEWGVYTTKIGWTDPVEFARRNDEFFAHYKAGTLDVHDYVRFATDAIRLQGATKFIAAHACYMRDVIIPGIQNRALALVQQHKTAGDLVVIATATNELVTRPIADAFGVTDLIAVELERDTSAGGTGWITGEIKGVPSMREGKLTRVEQWLAARNLQLSDVESTFYSDSMNDLPLLEKVTHPVATNPDARLRVIAKARGWRILDLF
jgi:HAD superfamily hydrolase (TIGR01490 family)